MFLNLQEANQALAAGNNAAYAYLAREVRRFLSQRHCTHAGFTYSPVELVEALYPEATARGDGILARRRIFKVLRRLAITDLADCAARGPEVKKFGRTMHVWLWHAPIEPRATCPNCGQPL